MKNVLKIRKAAVIIVLLSLGISCDNENNVDPVEDTTITGNALATPDLSILVQALTKADLAVTLQGSGPFTVFAPTNQAFTDFLATTPYETVDDVPTEVLTQILLNHVVAGTERSTDLTTGYIKTLATGEASENTLSMYVNTTDGVELNGGASVITADITASNGVIHLVDQVINLPTVVTHAIANPNFTTLVSVLDRTGQPNFVETLVTPGPFTVFAPTNAAFTALDAELDGGIAGVSDDNLTKVLQYHVVSPANVLAATLTEGQVETPILTPSQNFTILLSGGAKIEDANGRISNIIITDVQCSNGVIHAIDTVLLPIL